MKMAMVFSNQVHALIQNLTELIRNFFVIVLGFLKVELIYQRLILKQVYSQVQVNIQFIGQEFMLLFLLNKLLLGVNSGVFSQKMCFQQLKFVVKFHFLDKNFSTHLFTLFRLESILQYLYLISQSLMEAYIRTHLYYFTQQLYY